MIFVPYSGTGNIDKSQLKVVGGAAALGPGAPRSLEAEQCSLCQGGG